MKLLRSTSTSTVDGVTATPTPTEPDAVASTAEPASSPARRALGIRARRARFSGLTAPTSPALVYLGIFLLAAGFGLLAFTWSRVAGTAIVALQLPYVVSGATTGLGLLILGVLAIYLGVKRRDAWQRDRRLEQLAAAFEAIARASTPRSDDEDAALD
ncbi:MAG: hypothetical protein WAT66_10305 [Actinomycetota bacterium]